MNEMFRLRIAAKRQITIPQRMINALMLAEGDEIRIEVTNGEIKSVETCKLVPTRLFSKQVLEDLESREREMASGRSIPLQVQALDKSADREEKTASTKTLASLLVS